MNFTTFLSITLCFLLPILLIFIFLINDNKVRLPKPRWATACPKHAAKIAFDGKLVSIVDPGNRCAQCRKDLTLVGKVCKLITRSR